MPGMIDTNILLYAANADADGHNAAARFLIDAGNSADQWYLTEGILYEFLRVSTHHLVFPRPLAWENAIAFLRPFLQSPAFRVLTAEAGHWDRLEGELRSLAHPSGNLFFDIRTVVLMREHGIRTIYTTDKDFLQFRDLNVIDPLHKT